MGIKIVCEAGINHNGDFKTALKLIDAAKEINADVVKFQTFWCFPDLKQYEFGNTQWYKLFQHAEDVGIEMYSTAFCQKSINFLSRIIEQDTWKIPSGMTTNYKYLLAIHEINPQKVILSTGMTSAAEIITVAQVLEWPKDMTVLHCVTGYPIRTSDANLGRIRELRKLGFTKVGFSDHTMRMGAALRAVGMGACMIEKHFTLDRMMDGPDHGASLEPAQFRVLIELIREGEEALQERGFVTEHPEYIKEIRERMMISWK